MKNKIFIGVFFAALAALAFGCKDELQVGNPNSPTLAANVNNEAGIIALAQGGVYINGFQNGDVWLGDSYFSLNYGYSELMAGYVGADASNQLVSVMNLPAFVKLDDGSQIDGQVPSISTMRTYNTRASTGAGYNPTYYQWLNAYALNNACNVVLAQVKNIKFTGDQTSKVAAIRAWCYWWKGWAYSAIGSLYYSGLIIDDAIETTSKVNGNYVVQSDVINRSNAYLTKADSVLSTVSSEGDYSEVMTGLIPASFQLGHGNPPSVAEFKKNIKSMLARNILVNHLSPFVNFTIGGTISKATITPMQTADWNNVLTLASAGVTEKDNVFAGHSAKSNSVFTATLGTVSAKTAGSNATSTFKLGERAIQNFKAGDARLANFTKQYPGATKPTLYTNLFYSTRWSLLKSDLNPPGDGVYQYANWAIGAYELYIGTSYEENALMLAEANIMLGNIDAGLAYVDAVRDYQGANVTHVAGTNLTQVGAMKELVKERAAALLFRGLSFYDARRWGWTYDVSLGGGSYGNVFLTKDGVMNTNATINYNFMDYWDVPADESVLNPAKGSVPTMNPNF